MSFLSEILDSTRARLAAAMKQVPLAEMRNRAAARRDAPRGFLAALRAPGRRVIAEIKRASPSKGAIDLGLDPAALAQRYEQGGAAALSVLTEPAFFKGSAADLAAARAATCLPVLRKDFIIDPYQVYETAAMGADAMLLIVRIVDDAKLRELYALARSLGLDVLVEAYDETDVARANALGARLVGINARDLTTFRVDLSRVVNLARNLSPEATVVSLSGIQTPADFHQLVAARLPRVLVGEALVRDPALLPVFSGTLRGAARVKVCGLTTPEEAHLVAELGFGAVGTVFYPPSPRNVTPRRAAEIFRGLPASVARVGVFVDATPAAMIATGREAGLTVIQCHGSESLETIRAVEGADFRVVKTVRSFAEAVLLPPSIGVLTELSRGSLPGGNGATWDWAAAAPLAACRAFALAGGLTPDNLLAAATASHAAAFDLSSGVERAPGVKSPERLRRLASMAGQLSAAPSVFSF